MEAVGYPRQRADTFTGWDGEDKVAELFRNQGFEVQQPPSRKLHYDLLVNGVVRVDVKSAHLHIPAVKSRSNSRAWHFRIGKCPTVDLLALYRMEHEDVFLIPWFAASETAMSIGGESKYEPFRNNWKLLRDMIDVRDHERVIILKILSIPHDERMDYLRKVLELRGTGKTFEQMGAVLGCCKQTAHKLVHAAERAGLNGGVKC